MCCVPSKLVTVVCYLSIYVVFNPPISLSSTTQAVLNFLFYTEELSFGEDERMVKVISILEENCFSTTLLTKVPPKLSVITKL